MYVGITCSQKKNKNESDFPFTVPYYHTSVECLSHSVAKIQAAFGIFFVSMVHEAGFSGGSVVKNLPANAGDTGWIPGSERSFGEGKGNPLRYSYLVNYMGKRGEGPGGLQPMKLQRIGHNWASTDHSSLKWLLGQRVWGEQELAITRKRTEI